MIELLRQGKNLKITGKLGRVLEIGTGCGYQAALLSHLSQEVYSIERIKGLFEKAKDNLRPMRIPNLHLILGDGMAGYEEGAPYSAIISAAGGDAIPQSWLDQLAIGGRIVAPVAVPNGIQNLVVIDKTPLGIEKTWLEPVHFVPLKSGVI
jgi:protein-L-isoaspartate(D-aspartate) O-methyltransferase